jgi:hypothetical protein
MVNGINKEGGVQFVIMGTMNFHFNLSHRGVRNLQVVWIQLKVHFMHVVRKLQLRQKIVKKLI